MKKKVLIIEDEENLKFLLVQKFTEEGFDVEEAIDGEEGMKKLKENKPDLVLLDLLLPGIDGFEVLSRLKRDSNLESIPVIIISNFSQEGEIERGLKLGAIDYLIKADLTLDKIVERVRKALK